MLWGKLSRETHHPPPLCHDDRYRARERNLLIDRSQRLELAGQSVGDELKDPLWAIDVLELMFAEIAQVHARNLVVVDDPGCRA